MDQQLSRRSVLISALAGAASVMAARSSSGKDSTDPMTRWQSGVTVSPVSRIANRHTMHTYYLLNPESPDGRKVVFFASTERAGHVGQICVLDRQTGKETVLADDVHTEDAHRVALQQWTDGGKAVAYHEVVNKRWRVVVVDLETGKRRIVAEDRQLGLGRGDGHVLPLYGCHWEPGDARDWDLYAVATGELRTAVSIGEVEAMYGDWLKEEFGGKPTSIAFPTLSPDHQRVFFKIAAGSGGDNFMSSNASHRQG